MDQIIEKKAHNKNLQKYNKGKKNRQELMRLSLALKSQSMSDNLSMTTAADIPQKFPGDFSQNSYKMEPEDILML